MASVSRETITNLIKWMIGIEELPQGTVGKIRLLAASGILVCTTWFSLRFVKNFREKRALHRKGKMHSQKLRQELADLAERLKSGNVTKEARDHITSLSTADLIDQLQNGQLKPSEVLEAYQAKALEVHEKTNCLVGLVDDAEEMAKKLDSSTEKGPLHGVPIGIKEFHMLKGHPFSSGFSKGLDIPVTEDSVFIQVLKKQGAIPFVRTNVPQGGLSEKGVLTMEGQTVVSTVYGPMCRDLDCLVRVTKAQMTPPMYELDLSVPHLTFNTEMYESKRPLRIGYFYQDGQVHAVPASERAVKQAKDILERRGHTLVAWTPPRQDEVMWAWLRLMNGDGGETMLQELSRNEEIGRCLTLYLMYKYPVLLRKIVAAYWTYIRKDPHMARVIDGFKSTPNGTVKEHGTYLIMYNLLNMPAGVMPVTKVKDEDIVQLSKLQNLNERLQFVREDAIGSEGLPVAVQVAAAPFREEMVLRVMKEVDSGLPSS